MKVFVVVGMPASGKNIARIYAQAREILYFATGDLVRNEIRKRGLEHDAAAAADVSTELRGADGLGVTRLALAAAIQSGADILFMEGMRSQPEIELIRARAECVVIAFLAPGQLRLQRITARQRSDDSAQLFGQRDARKIEYGTVVSIVLADEYILNTGTLEEAVEQIEQIIRRRKKGGMTSLLSVPCLLIPYCIQDDAMIYTRDGGAPCRDRFLSVTKKFNELSNCLISADQLQTTVRPFL